MGEVREPWEGPVGRRPRGCRHSFPIPLYEPTSLPNLRRLPGKFPSQPRRCSSRPRTRGAPSRHLSVRCRRETAPLGSCLLEALSGPTCPGGTLCRPSTPQGPRSVATAERCCSRWHFRVSMSDPTQLLRPLPHPEPTAPPPATSSDELQLLTDALLAYFHEVQTDAKTCRQHAATTAIRHTSGCLSTIQHFPAGKITEDSLRQGVASLPSWEQSPWAKAKLSEWKRTRRVLDAREKKFLLNRGVTWEGYPLWIHVAVPEGALLTVELLLPSLPCDVPGLPPRMLATTLRCHEYLIPTIVAQPLSLVVTGRGTRCLTIPEYFQRAMPSTLYASQCFFAQSAGR